MDRFDDCKICGDKSTGIHYGVSTCVACKLFYKRSLDKYQAYHCFNGNNCEIDLLNRNRCKFCRYKKCLAQGMALERIRLGKMPKITIKSNNNNNNNNDDQDCIIIEGNFFYKI